jgi:hypothetical protein
MPMEGHLDDAGLPQRLQLKVGVAALPREESCMGGRRGVWRWGVQRCAPP